MAIPTGTGPRTPRGGIVVGVDGSPGSDGSAGSLAALRWAIWEASAGSHITVTAAPVHGHPAEVLAQQADRAELLVVGSRGHGRIFGALLGSVSQYLAGHAACRVVVIKPLAHQHGGRSRAGR